MFNITVGVLTISNRCFWGEAEDTSGPQLKSMLEKGLIKNCRVVKTHIVDDRVEDVEEVLKEWSDSECINLILTTGGTGIASTDVTPEATTAVVNRIIPGISHLMFQKSSEVTPLAALSRSVAGVRGTSLIVNLPGSRKAAKECLQAIAGVIPHAVDLIIGRKKAVENVHSSLGQKQSSVKASDPARRKTSSPYERIPVSMAQSIVLDSVYLMKKEMTVGLEEALGHVLAQDLPSKVNLPPFDVSLKDGYAVLSSGGNNIKIVIGESKAGDQPSDEVVPSGSCIRIGTGAPMPPGTDSVVMVEKTAPEASCGDSVERIKILRTPSKGEEVRKKGSDLRKGSLVLPFGTYLDASAVGFCASAGVSSMRVFKKPLVAVISTGDELISPGEPPSPGKVWDSNRITLISLLKEHGFEAMDRGIVKDEPDALRDALERAFQEADVVVSTGSMSMGERDYLKDILVADFNAEIHFGRVLMKPGLPTTFATVAFEKEMKLFFGLPGNPASAFVTSHLFLLPALRKISGKSKVLPIAITVHVPLSENVPFEERPHYVRGTLTGLAEHGFLAEVTGDQRSSRISSCVNANCLILFSSDSRLLKERGQIKCKGLLIGDITI